MESLCNRKYAKFVIKDGRVGQNCNVSEQYVFDLPAILDAQNLQNVLFNHLCAKFTNLTWLLLCPS